MENTTRKQIVGASDVEREGQKEIKFLNWRRRSYSCHFGLSVFCVFPSIVGFDLSCARGKFTRQPFDLRRSWKGCDVVDCTRKGEGRGLGAKSAGWERDVARNSMSPTLLAGSRRPAAQYVIDSLTSTRPRLPSVVLPFAPPSLISRLFVFCWTWSKWQF